ncbi:MULTISPECIES: NAD(P)H-hydrate dehydratase [unclassified Variovorax]|uniref:NAD(P)H-hydrate dehydratase n=1 Tax=unclassified Variovorax TaxID=663243 RepID=UPI00076BF6D9|nr:MULTISPECIES: NAD(P)H-hydrate dehydratase [unclassified Variovorax]KWT74109.1 YjeF protein, function unknown [Variovorax sp. WDL1]PNG52199.1 Bifunctional NAD(P)H-hydrate repair enzyme Nnr [Variovorax sp. B4]PNG54739.1 Bifunctional NAD(P)H-hydrate repair enzyme Nnr [Variovorax sp. B2]VTV15732.1 Nicotinamide nucleotide repair protein [Variovorax sp. WDL1]
MAPARATPLTEASLAHWPLPDPGPDADKESRGRVLVIAGSAELPGAALLAGSAALRAGAGKLTIASPASIASGVALAIPESRVIALPETRGGGIAARGCEALAPLAAQVAAVVVGPGLGDERGSMAFVRRLLPLFRECTVLLDSIAMSVATERAFDQPVLLTPHAGEMAHLSGLPKEAIAQEALAVAGEAAARWNACVVLKGASTVIATPQRRAWRFDGGSPGLATSGSGDVLAGLMGGFAARGLPPEKAAAWAVVVHARAGKNLGQRVGPLGYLASELAGEVPGVVRRLAR